MLGYDVLNTNTNLKYLKGSVIVRHVRFYQELKKRSF